MLSLSLPLGIYLIYGFLVNWLLKQSGILQEFEMWTHFPTASIPFLPLFKYSLDWLMEINCLRIPWRQFVCNIWEFFSGRALEDTFPIQEY